MSISTDLDLLLLERNQRLDAFRVRALTQELYDTLSDYDDQIQTIVDAGSIDTIPDNIKATLNQSWQVMKDARSGIEGNAGIMEMLTWGT